MVRCVRRLFVFSSCGNGLELWRGSFIILIFLCAEESSVMRLGWKKGGTGVHNAMSVSDKSYHVSVEAEMDNTDPYRGNDTAPYRGNGIQSAAFQAKSEKTPPKMIDTCVKSLLRSLSRRLPFPISKTPSFKLTSVYWRLHVR